MRKFTLKPSPVAPTGILELPLGAAKLQPTFDLPTGLSPPAFDQGYIDTCTCNSTAWGMFYARNKEWLVSPGPVSRLDIYANARIPPLTDSGAFLSTVVMVLTSSGACYEAGDNSWPYDQSQVNTMPPAGCKTVAVTNKVTKVYNVPQTQAGIKSALAAGWPVIFGLQLFPGIQGANVTKTGVIPMPAASAQTIGGHSMVLTGYDDTNKVFHGINSWGADWGKNGYFTIPYKYILDTKLCFDMLQLRMVG